MYIYIIYIDHLVFSHQCKPKPERLILHPPLVTFCLAKFTVKAHRASQRKGKDATARMQRRGFRGSFNHEIKINIGMMLGYKLG